MGHVKEGRGRDPGGKVETREWRTEDAQFMNPCFVPQEGEEGRKEKDNQTFLLSHWTNLCDSLLGYDPKTGSLSVGGRRNENETVCNLI